jgi:hypothetical protein
MTPNQILTYDDTRDIAIKIVNELASDKKFIDVDEDDHAFDVQDSIQDTINNFFGGLDIDEEKGFLLLGGNYVKEQDLPIKMDKEYKIVSNDTIVFDYDKGQTFNILSKIIVKNLLDEGALPKQNFENTITLYSIIHTKLYEVFKPFHNDSLDVKVIKVDTSYGEDLPNEVQDYIYKFIGDADNLSGIDVGTLIEDLETHFKWSFEYGLDMTPYIFYKIE